MTQKKGTFFSDIPEPIKYFLKRSLIFFVIWKLIYYLVFLPLKQPDKFLTDVTAYTTGKLYILASNSKEMNIVSETRPVYRAILYIDNKRGIGITDGCNGLELIILYVAFLVCFNTSNRKRLMIYAIVGSVLIFFLNIFRCAALAHINLYYSSYTDFAHHYLFTLVAYAFIFLLWIYYSKKLYK